MATLLLAVIYIMFIGIGVPDSLFGVAWPAIYPEFGVGVSSANLVTITVAGCTIISSLLSARLISRFGTSIVTAVSTAMTAFALLGSSISSNMLFLVLFAIPLGLGAGAIDSALNSFVALHYRATHMNFMQCFYGIGVSVSPFLMGIALEGHTWQYGYRLAFILQTVLATIGFLSLPLWRKLHLETESKTAGSADKILSVGQMLQMPAVRWVCLYFFAACAVELTFGTWCSTYLVEIRNITPSRAANIALFYYMGIAAGRFVSGLMSVKLSGWKLIGLGMAVLITSIILLLLPLLDTACSAALFLAGCGVGPLFPNMMHLTGKNFSPDIALSISGIQMTATYTGILLMPALFGLLAQYLSAGLYPWYLLVLALVTITAFTGLKIACSKTETHKM